MRPSSSSSSKQSFLFFSLYFYKFDLPGHFVRRYFKMNEVTCTYCHRNITVQFYTQCAQCENFFLCQDCFAVGVELYPHENSHSYRVRDCLEVPMFMKDWSALEELQMLKGIEKYGMGNWLTISKEVFTGNRTPKQLEEHYFEFYMGIHGVCLPPQTMMNGVAVCTESFRDTNHEVHNESLFSNDKATSEKDLKHFDDELHNILGTSVIPKMDAIESYTPANVDVFHTSIINGYSLNEPVVRDIGKELGVKAKEKSDIRERIAQLPGSDLPGFMPLREDFDVEYENEAEEMLADMDFSPDDHPSEVELKLQVIKIYNFKLAERNRRKKFVIDRNLIDSKQQMQQEKKRLKDEREIVGKLRVFARFHSMEEHENLVDCVIRAKRLRQQIDLYKTYRQMGIKSLDEVRVYELEKKDREAMVKIKKAQADAPHLYNNGRQSHGGSSRQGQGQGQDDGMDGSQTISGKRRSRAAEEKEHSNSTADISHLSDREKRAKEKEKQEVTQAASSSGRSGSGRGGRGRGSANKEADEEAQRDEYIATINKAPGAEILSPMEMGFCSRLPMLPLHFLAAKDAIVREAYRNGTLTEDGVMRVLNLEGMKAAAIFDFFVKDLQINEAAFRS